MTTYEDYLATAGDNPMPREEWEASIAKGAIRPIDPTQGGEAYHTGYEDHEQGESRFANPYGAGTWDREEWFRGWDEAAS